MQMQLTKRVYLLYFGSYLVIQIGNKCDLNVDHSALHVIIINNLNNLLLKIGLKGGFCSTKSRCPNGRPRSALRVPSLCSTVLLCNL